MTDVVTMGMMGAGAGAGVGRSSDVRQLQEVKVAVLDHIIVRARTAAASR